MAFGLNTLLAIAGYACIALAWWAYRKERSSLTLGAVLLCAGLLRLSASLDPFLHPWDERYHALVGKHLAEDPRTPTLYPDGSLPHDPGNWTTSHIWLHKPPMALWCIAAAIKLFGATPLAVRIPSVLLSLLGAGLILWLGGEFRSRLVGTIAGLLFAINGHLIELASGRTSTDHVDAIFMVFVLAAIAAGWELSGSRDRRWALWCGVLSGFAFLTKSWPAFLVLPVVATMMHTRGISMREAFRPLSIALTAALLTPLPWIIYLNVRFPSELSMEHAGLWSHFGQGIEEHGRPWHYYWTQLPMMQGEFIALVLIWTVSRWLRDRANAVAVLLVWSLVPFVVFSFAETKMPAYTAIAAPAWFLLIAMAMVAWWTHATSEQWQRWALRIGAIGLFALPVRFSLDRLRPWSVPVAPYTIPLSIAVPPPQDHRCRL